MRSNPGSYLVVALVASSRPTPRCIRSNGTCKPTSRRNPSLRALTPTVIGLLESRPWMGHATVVNNGRGHPGSGVAHPACAPGEPQDRGRGAPPRDRPPLRRPPASSSEVPGWVVPSNGRFQGSGRVDGRREVMKANCLERYLAGDGWHAVSVGNGWLKVFSTSETRRRTDRPQTASCFCRRSPISTFRIV